MITTHLSSSRDGIQIDALCANAKVLGVEAVAIHLAPEHPVQVESTEPQCLGTRQVVADAGLRVAVALVPFDPQSHFGCCDADIHARAVNRVKQALQRAAWLGADALVVTPATVNPPDSQPAIGCTYEEGLNGTYAALQQLRFTSESTGVHLALVAGVNRFLLSPIELRELLDEQHSPAIGACIDLNAAGSAGWSAGWIGVLRSRVQCVTAVTDHQTVSAPRASDLEDVVRVLHGVRYEGPICAATGADFEAISRGLAAADSV